jgi:3-oxoacyl-[acyl-carrier protein] reductase
MIGTAIRSAAAGIAVTSTATTADDGHRRLDVLDDASIDELVASLPVVNYVLFAQGVQPSRSLAQTDRAHVNRMLETNVTGILMCLQRLVPRLAEGSSVVLVSSVAVRKGSYDPSYAAAKGAIDALVRSLAVELRATCRVNAIAPGLVDASPVHRSMTPAQAERHSSRMFGKRLVTADALAMLVLELWTNPFINAAVVPIDGGYFD